MNRKDDIVKIYDDMFNQIGAERWSVVHDKGLLHQVVHLWIYSTEPDGRWLYFVQRAKDREDFPGLYDIPVSGHIDPEETFSQAVVTITQKLVGLELFPEYLKHAGNIHQTIDEGDFHDNAFCQVYVKRLDAPIPEFKVHDAEMLFKVKYEDFCQWMHRHEGTLPIYGVDGRFLKDSSAGDWWWIRQKEFISIVQPYIDAQL